MIDNVTLTFLPKSRNDFLLYESILSRFQYKREKIIKKLESNIVLCIFTKKKYIQVKVFRLSEYLCLGEITNLDYIKFEKQLNDSIKDLNLSLTQLRLTRIDYKLDLKMTDIEMQEYLYIFSKLRQRYYSLKKDIYYNQEMSRIESIYYKGAKFNINIYDKQNQLNKNGIYDSTYNNILRVEVQIKSKELSYYCKSHRIEKELKNFWQTSVRDNFFNDLLINKFLYTGDYYNLNDIKGLLDNIKQSAQQKILKFCKHIAEEDITEAINSLSRGTAIKYINELSRRNINPITTKNLNKLFGIKTILEQKKKAV